MQWLQHEPYLWSTRMNPNALDDSSSVADMGSALSLLGRLLCYPGTDYDVLLTEACRVVESPRLTAFRDQMTALSHDQREELYTSTFDVTPRCVPYVSIHLFGEENFKRGEFMAALQHQYELCKFETEGELPDHIGYLLRYGAILEASACRELVEFCLLGPLAKIGGSLPESNPYRLALKSVDGMLRAGFPGIEPALSPVEQMRQHGGCPTVSQGCHCGPATGAASEPTPQIIDGPEDKVEGASVAPVPPGVGSRPLF